VNTTQGGESEGVDEGMCKEDPVVVALAVPELIGAEVTGFEEVNWRRETDCVFSLGGGRGGRVGGIGLVDAICKGETVGARTGSTGDRATPSGTSSSSRDRSVGGSLFLFDM